jgi:integrase
MIPLRSDTGRVSITSLSIRESMRDTNFWSLKVLHTEESVPQAVPTKQSTRQAVTDFASAIHRAETHQDHPQSSSDGDSDDDSDSDSEAASSSDEDEDNAVEKLFQRGHHLAALPLVAQLTTSALQTLLTKAQPAPIHQWVDQALSKSTRDAHRRALRRLDTMTTTSRRVAVDIIDHLMKTKTSKDWTWATTLKNLTQTQSALKLLPLYRGVTHGIILTSDPHWSQALKYVQQRANSETPRTPKAMTTAIFRATYDNIQPLLHRVALGLMWFTAARVGDILSLRKEDLQVNPDGTLQVTIVHGKSAKLRGAYTVHTTSLPAPILADLGAILHSPRAQSPAIFPNITSSSMLPLYRTVDNAMEAKSVRRGSLQTMAANGVPHDTLQRYSGHTKERTLLRYLGWGRITSSVSIQMAQAGRYLLPESSTNA